jgi:hypothetical protein
MWNGKCSTSPTVVERETTTTEPTQICWMYEWIPDNDDKKELALALAGIAKFSPHHLMQL